MPRPVEGWVGGRGGAGGSGVGVPVPASSAVGDVEGTARLARRKGGCFLITNGMGRQGRNGDRVCKARRKLALGHLRDRVEER